MPDEEKTAEAESEQPKKSNKERLKEITDSIEQGIKEVFESDKYRNYLETMSRFHSYSVNNTMLIYMQKPDATLVAGFNKWRDKFGRNVKKGEHGIKIIAPTPFKKKVEEQKLDPDTKAPLFDKDGKPIMEEKTVQIPMFKPVSVFDVSQTEGKELPELAATLYGKVENYEMMKEAIQKAAPVPIIYAEIDPKFDGFFSHKAQSITIREGMSEPQTICAMIHETAHSILHNTDDKEKDTQTEEVEAESIAYSVCKYFGIDTSKNSFGYLAAWSKDKEVKELRESLETISSTSSQLITSIEKECLALEKAKEELSKAEEPVVESSTPVIDETAESMTLLVDDKVYLEVHRIDDGVNVDYSFYDKDTFKLIDGGYSDFSLDSQPESVFELAKQIAVSFDYEGRTFVPADIDGQIEQANTLDAAFEKNAPEEPEIVPIDVPDPNVTVQAMNDFGYLSDTMHPLSKERAVELYDAGCQIFLLHDDNTESEVNDRDDILSHYGFLGVEKDEWQRFSPIAAENDASKEMDKAFLDSKRDSYAIYQLRSTEDTAYIRFLGTEDLEKLHAPILKENYQCVYSGSLSKFGVTEDQRLGEIYEKFNIDHPADFKGHSLSVSDIVALKQDGNVSYHYVDNIGFTTIPNFGKEYLKTAELSIEDDANMIDGIINNGKKEEPKAVREDAVKPKESVLGKLKSIKEQIAQQPAAGKKQERGIEP